MTGACREGGGYLTFGGGGLLKIVFLRLKKHLYNRKLNTNISHQLFDLMNSQSKNTNSKDDFVMKNLVETFVLKI